MSFSLFRREPECPKHLDPVLFKTLFVGKKCPDCGSTDFFMGPQGGLAQNVMCANPNCGSRFNLAPFDDGVWCSSPFMIDRISDPSPKKTEGSHDHGGNSLGTETGGLGQSS